MFIFCILVSFFGSILLGRRHLVLQPGFVNRSAVEVSGYSWIAKSYSKTSVLRLSYCVYTE